jgi:putative tryptophan/tyrosine transport system substrate-binding protein
VRQAVVVFSALLVALTATGPAPAQPGGKVARLGMLCTTACAGREHDALMSELAKLGWVEGRALAIDRRAAGGQIDRLPQLAVDLVASRPDVIVAGSPQPNLAARKATSEIPIVMIAVADPVAVGLAQSLARPGGNVTGLATLVPGGFIGKQAELLRELLPNAKRLAALTNPLNEVHRRWYPLEVPPAAARLGFELETIEVRHRHELGDAITTAKAHAAEALLVVGDPLFHAPSDRIPSLVGQAALPAIYLSRSLTEAGGLMSYGPDFVAMYRRAAHFVDRILKGGDPAEIPIEQPTKFELVINLKTAKLLGLTIPPTLLARADEVIE